jgi:transposase-like protein
LTVLNDLKNRGVKDILIACVDGLKGFPEAIQSVFPQTEVQLCIVHLIRNSTRQVAYGEMKEVVADLKPIYTAPNADEAECQLDAFDKKWTMPIKRWKQALQQFAIYFPVRVSVNQP